MTRGNSPTIKSDVFLTMSEVFLKVVKPTSASFKAKQSVMFSPETQIIFFCLFNYVKIFISIIIILFISATETIIIDYNYNKDGHSQEPARELDGT